MARYKRGTVFALYRGDEVIGLYDSIDRISEITGYKRDQVRHWQYDGHHRKVDNLPEKDRKSAWLVQVVQPD